MDEIATQIADYKPEIADRFRRSASAVLAKIYHETIKRKIDFVFDGTFAHSHAIENLERAIRQGYQVKIYYIHQEPRVAWRFTQDRELVERRAIDRTKFIESYLSLELNLQELCKKHKDVTLNC